MYLFVARLQISPPPRMSARAIAITRIRRRRVGRMLKYSSSTEACQAARFALLCSRTIISWLKGTAAADKTLNWVVMDVILGWPDAGGVLGGAAAGSGAEAV